MVGVEESLQFGTYERNPVRLERKTALPKAEFDNYQIT